MTSNDLVTHLHAYLQKYKPQIIIDLNEIKAITIGAKIIIITLRGHPTLNPRSPSIFLGSIYPRTTLKLYHWVGFRNRCLLGIHPNHATRLRTGKNLFIVPYHCTNILLIVFSNVLLRKWVYNQLINQPYTRLIVPNGYT